MTGLSELVAKSGDSEFVGIQYNGSILELDLTLGETEESVRVRILTNCVRTDLPVEESPIHKTCRLVYDEMKGLAVSNGHYVPATDFASLMEEARLGRVLLYGTKVGMYCGIISAVGYTRLVSCLIRTVDDVVVVPRI